MSNLKPFKLHSVSTCIGSKEISVINEVEDKEWGKNFIAHTGIRKCFVLDKDETLLSLALECVMDIDQLGPDNVPKHLICVTQSFEPRTPGLAYMLQKELGWNIPAYELNSACQGFVEALELSAKLPGLTLIVCADELGTLLRSQNVDKNLRHIFSDGVTATLVSGAGEVRTLRDPNLAEELVIHGRDDSQTVMHGENISHAATKMVPDLLKTLALEAVPPVFLHQANLSIIKRIEAKSGLKSHNTIGEYGNLSASSIPFGLAQYLFNVRDHWDDLVAKEIKMTVCGYGAGFSTSAACLILSDVVEL